MLNMEDRPAPMRCLEPGCPGEMKRQKLLVGDPLDRQAEMTRALLRVMGPGRLECDRCGHSESAYSAVGRRAFTVEPLE